MRLILVLTLLCSALLYPAAQDAPPRVLYGIVSPGEVDDIPAADALFEQVAADLTGVEFERVAYDPDLFAEAPLDVVAVAGVTVNEEMYFRVVREPLAEVSDILMEVRFPVMYIETVFAVEIATVGTLYGMGRCEEALSYLRYPDEFSIWRATVTGNCAVLEGDYEAAAAAYEPITEQLRYERSEDEQYVPAVVNLAWVRLQQGDNEGAFALMDELVNLYAAEGEPFQHAAMLARRSRFHALAFNFDAAIADATAAIELEDNAEALARYYKLRGDHIFLIYEWDRVLDDYNRAVELDPDYADAYFARGVLFYTQGPRPAALEDFQRFSELVPDDPRAAEAAEYIESIEAELAALGGDDTGAFGPSD